MIFPRSPIAGYMTIVPVEVMIKAPLSPNTLRTHLIVSASHAAVDRQKTKPMALLYRMLMSHHKPCGADISKTCARVAPVLLTWRAVTLAS
jgi:hypothetical protein